MPTETALPQGKITIVFTDIENSSRMTSDLGNDTYMRRMRDPHARVLRAAFERHQGVPVQTQGDSFMTVFQRADDALACVDAIQKQLAAEPITWPGSGSTWTLKVRIGVHTTEQEVLPCLLSYLPPDSALVARNVEYSGGDTNFAARIGGLGVGGQVIVAASTHQAAASSRQYPWREWPNRHLKSFEAASETVWELLYDGQSRGEPGARWVPEWYQGEKNRFIARPLLQETIYQHFKNRTFDGSASRLVTLKAEGGMGKTRLAIACGVQMAGLFQHGVCFVDLTGRPRSREAVAEAVGAALGLSGPAAQPDPLLAALRSQETLLVLDNYESVECPEAARFLGDLIVQTNSVRLLVTGRAAVKVEDVEQIISLDDGMTPEEAEALFLAYARLKKGQEWTPAEAEQPHLRRILDLTERIPLATEFAAAWVARRSLKEIADGLEATPLGKMSGVTRSAVRADRSSRHDSLTRSLDWSYSLLENQVQEGFAALGLFAASFAPEAVAAVTDQNVEEARDLLDRLDDVSLVRRNEVNGVSRYRFHRFTRAYTSDKLRDLPAADAVRRRFVAYYCEFVADNGDLNDANTRARLDTEWRNAVAAAGVIKVTEEWSAVRALFNLGDFLSLRGLWAEQERLYQHALAAAHTFDSRLGEGKALINLGNVYKSQGKWDDAESAYGQGLTIFRELGDRLGEGRTLGNLGNVYQDRGQWDDAEDTYEQSLTIFRELGDRLGEGAALVNLGNFYQSQGKWDDAESASGQGLIICRELGDRQNEGKALINLGNVYKSRGEWDDAESAYGQGLTIFRELGDRQNEGGALGNLALLMQSQQQTVKALVFAREAVAVLETTEDKALLAWVQGIVSKLEQP